MRSGAPWIRVDTGDAAMAVLLPIIVGLAVIGVVAFFRSPDAPALPGRIVIVADVRAHACAVRCRNGSRFARDRRPATATACERVPHRLARSG